MRSLIVSTGIRHALILVLGLGAIGITACSSPEEDADARGDNVEMPTTVQDQVEQEAVHSETSSSETINADTTTDTVTSDEDSVIINEGDSVANEQLGTHNNEDIADGTDEEEHVSTY